MPEMISGTREQQEHELPPRTAEAELLWWAAPLAAVRFFALYVRSITRECVSAARIAALLRLCESTERNLRGFLRRLMALSRLNDILMR